MGGTPVAYQYVLGRGPAQTVQAPSGTVSVQITPTREQSELTIYAVAADDTVSGGTTDFFSSVAASACRSLTTATAPAACRTPST